VSALRTRSCSSTWMRPRGRRSQTRMGMEYGAEFAFVDTLDREDLSRLSQHNHICRHSLPLSRSPSPACSPPQSDSPLAPNGGGWEAAMIKIRAVVAFVANGAILQCALGVDAFPARARCGIESISGFLAANFSQLDGSWLRLFFPPLKKKKDERERPSCGSRRGTAFPTMHLVAFVRRPRRLEEALGLSWNQRTIRAGDGASVTRWEGDRRSRNISPELQSDPASGALEWAKKPEDLEPAACKSGPAEMSDPGPPKPKSRRSSLCRGSDFSSLRHGKRKKRDDHFDRSFVSTRS
jgi:hypothetical protein